MLYYFIHIFFYVINKIILIIPQIQLSKRSLKKYYNIKMFPSQCQSSNENLFIIKIIYLKWSHTIVNNFENVLLCVREKNMTEKQNTEIIERERERFDGAKNNQVDFRSNNTSRKFQR